MSTSYSPLLSSQAHADLWKVTIEMLSIAMIIVQYIALAWRLGRTEGGYMAVQ